MTDQKPTTKKEKDYKTMIIHKDMAELIKSIQFQAAKQGYKISMIEASRIIAHSYKHTK